MTSFVGILSISCGGALGALMRVAVSYYITKNTPSHFPWGTLTVNLMGCFLIGFLWAMFDKLHTPNPVKFFILFGALGAFTTFSTFGLEAITLFSQGQIKWAISYLLASNLGGLLLVGLGLLSFRYISLNFS